MFDSLSERLGGIFGKLTGRGALSEAHVREALREIRVALLEADVALPVVKDFIKKIQDEATGQKVIKSVTPGQMVIKIVNDALIEMLGEQNAELNLNAPAPAPILMVGLQGSGKTTTTGKLAKRLTEKNKKKVLMASLDVYRPAAIDQLEQLGKQIGVETLPVTPDEKPLDIAARAMSEGRKGGFDIVMLDTAGRLHLDEGMMAEVAAVKKAVSPIETLLVADAMTGQDAVTLADSFHKQVGVTGIVLTRIDGDSRGGAALSMRAVTGCPIKFLGTGEKLDGLDAFHPDRLAGRILGMGDVVSLVEQAAEKLDQQEAEKVAKRMMDGQFDFNDMLSQIRQVQKLGDLDGLMAMIPGIAKAKKQMAALGAGAGAEMMKKTEAIIQSMTVKERKNPQLIKASRKKRIAAGSGTSVQDVNKLIKQHQQMAAMMKKMKKFSKKGMFPGMGGGMPQMPDMNALKDLDPSALQGDSPLLNNPLSGGSSPFGGSTPFTGNPFAGKFKP